MSAIVYSPHPERTGWIEAELARGRTVVQVARNIAHVVAALVADPAPRPQLLVIDIDALTGGELLELHQIRDHGWCGTIVALGRVPPSLRRSLCIERAIRPPFVEDALFEQVAHLHSASASTTMPIPTL